MTLRSIIDLTCDVCGRSESLTEPGDIPEDWLFEERTGTWIGGELLLIGTDLLPGESYSAVCPDCDPRAIPQ